MGTNYAPLVADLFLFCYEMDFMMSLSDDNQADDIDAFNTTGPLKKIFHYAKFQKFFHIFIIHLWSRFYNTYYQMFMPFCFYKPYQRIIRQQLYINTKYIPMKYNNIL